jgi:uncharacterized membrane protein YfcA
MMSVPLMLQVAPLSFVNGFWLPVLIACDLATIRHYPKEWEPRVIARLAPGMLIGILGATFLLRMLIQAETGDQKDVWEAWLKIGIAVISFAFVGMSALPKARERTEPWRPGFLVSLPIGLAAGVTTMLAHAAGPIVTMFMLPHRLEKRTFVGTTGRFYFTFNSIKVPIGILLASTITFASLRYGLWLIALSPLGVWLGSWLNKRVSQTWFVRLVTAFLLFAAGKLVYDALPVLTS